MNNKRVAHVLRKFDPSEWGGTETHVAEVTRRMLPLGWKGEVFAPEGPEGTKKDKGLDPGVPIRRYSAFCPFLGPSERRRALVASSGNIVSLSLVARLALDEGIALAHLHTGNRIGGAVRTAMRLSSRPYVISIHGPLLAQAELVASDTANRMQGLRDIGQPFGLLLGARKVIDDAARVITFNDAEQEAVTAKVGRRAVRMDHGVDAERLAGGDAARARARWPELGDAPVVALVGRVCKQKNQLLAVRAFAAGAPKNYRLALGGAETDPGYRKTVEEEARSLGVADRVFFLGNLDREREVPDLLARASLVLVPSTHEAFGLAVLEGWAARRAVMFANSSGLCDLAKAAGGAAVVVPELDPNLWASAFQRYLGDDALREAAADAGRKLVEERYRWDAVARRLGDLYDEVLEENRRQRQARHTSGMKSTREAAW
jgi:glycosyltransferase involved in cell wall biosynthesis